MIRDIVLLFNMFALLIYKALFTAGVTVTHNLPENLKAGNEYTVELTINKGAVNGFAKFQQELPSGCTATAIETKNGSFSFVDNNIKIIWMSLPSDAEFKISYKVSPGKDAYGTHTVGGKFSYIENNEKKVFNLENKNVTISSDPAVASATTPSNSEPSSTGETGSSENNSSENQRGTQENANTASSETSSGSESAADVSISRTILNNSNNEFTVELTVKKGSVSGFAKLEEVLPAGTYASAIEPQGAIFSFVDQKAKFLWMSIPSQSEFKISYKVKADAGINSVKIEGLFSFLVNDLTQKVVISAEEVSLTGQAVASNDTGNQRQSGDQGNTTPDENNSITGQTDTQLANSSNQNNNDNTGTSNESSSSDVALNENNNTSANTGSQNPTVEVTKVQAGSKGVNYRVQVVATHRTVQPEAIKSLYNITDEIIAEMHEGWHKFTVGGYADYKAARDKRESVASKGVQGPFVTAYNNGSRITVQEALMISSQKWIR